MSNQEKKQRRLRVINVLKGVIEQNPILLLQYRKSKPFECTNITFADCITTNGCKIFAMHISKSYITPKPRQTKYLQARVSQNKFR